MTKVICDKHDIILKKDKKNKIFSIDMEIKNPNIILPEVLQIKLYDVLAKINSKYIEKMELVKEQGNRVEFLLLLKQVGKDMGLPAKYMYFEMIHERPSENKIIYRTKSIPHDGPSPEGYDLMYSEYGFMSIHVITPHHVKLYYEINMDIEDDVPIYMENIVGMMIKKVFFNFKQFIENSHN